MSTYRIYREYVKALNKRTHKLIYSGLEAESSSTSIMCLPACVCVCVQGISTIDLLETPWCARAAKALRILHALASLRVFTTVVGIVYI